MVRVSGPLVNVTTSASSVRDVQVHTKKVRAWGDGLMTPDPSQATLSNGVVEFEAAPGPVVMVLFMAEAGAETVSLVVGEGATQSLADAYSDGQMANDRDAGELAGILEQIRASVGGAAEARAGAEAAAEDAAGSAVSAGRDADRAEAAAGEAATEAAGLAADAVRLEVKEDADRSAAGATTATEKAAEAAGSATRAEEAEAGAVEAEEGAEAGQELSEDSAAVAVAAAIGVQTAFQQHAGVGSPEGKITAPSGATYVDTAATAGASQWVKSTPDGNTGWRVTYGDTGWRDITYLVPREVLAGEMLIRRSTSIAYIYFYNLQLEDSGVSYQDFGNFLPTGFYDPNIQWFYVGGLADRGAGYATGAVRVSRFGGLRVTDVKPGDVMTGLVSLSVGAGWPTSLPGIPY